MKQYGIYIRQGSGTPYMIHFYDNIYSTKQKLYEMIQLEEERQRPYFVDNDFFNNKYRLVVNLKYFLIKERDVSEWKNYSESEKEKETNNKIIYFNNFKNVLTK